MQCLSSAPGRSLVLPIACLERLDDECRTAPQILVLQPTRERVLACHIQILNLGVYMDVSCVGSFGGTDIRHDAEALRAENVPQVLVGKPGRIADLAGRGYLNCESVKLCVVDRVGEIIEVSHDLR